MKYSSLVNFFLDTISPFNAGHTYTYVIMQELDKEVTLKNLDLQCIEVGFSLGGIHSLTFSVLMHVGPTMHYWGEPERALPTALRCLSHNNNTTNRQDTRKFLNVSTRFFFTVTSRHFTGHIICGEVHLGHVA